jgi:hypothetical protein
MSGINGLGVTHDPSERLSYYLANAITEKRPNYAQAQANRNFSPDGKAVIDFRGT